MIYGYARISRKEQSVERQIRNIKAEYPTAVILKEASPGTKMDRPEWTKLHKKVKSGDVIVFDSVSRMSTIAVFREIHMILEMTVRIPWMHFLRNSQFLEPVITEQQQERSVKQMVVWHLISAIQAISFRTVSMIFRDFRQHMRKLHRLCAYI